MFFLFFFVFLIYFWLSLVAASGGHSSLRCAGLSLSRPLLLRSTGSRRTGSAVVAHGPSCSAACGIFPDQGSNLCPLHWQADSQPLRHQGSPMCFKTQKLMCFSQPTVSSELFYAFVNHFSFKCFFFRLITLSHQSFNQSWHPAYNVRFLFCADVLAGIMT